MLSNAYFLAKFRFDTAENEPAKNLQKFPPKMLILPLPPSSLILETRWALVPLLGLVLFANHWARDALAAIEEPLERRQQITRRQYAELQTVPCRGGGDALLEESGLD